MARADDAAVDAGPLLLVGQKPRVQEFFSGGDATFTIGITNTGTVTLQTVTVANANTASCNRSDLGPLSPGQSTSYTCSREDVDDSFLNTLQATGVADGGATDSHVSDAFVKVLSPDLRITKRPTTQTVRPGAKALFTIIVFNTSPDTILTNITVDDTAVNDCDFDPVVPVNLAPSDSFDYVCEQNNVQSPLTSVATVRGTVLTSGEVLTTADVAWVETLDMTAALSPQPTAVAEPGAPVTFHVTLTNSGSVPVTLTGLTTDKFGNILNPNTPAVNSANNTCLRPVLPTIQPYGSSFTCSFVAVAAGQPSPFVVTLTATAKDRDNQNETATATGTVTITNVPAEMNLSASADPPFIHPPSDNVTFNVRVDNNSAADIITLTELRDELLGNLDGRGTCNVPVDIPSGTSYGCSFSAVVSGQTGQQKTRTITATAKDDDLNPGTLTDSTEVTVNITDLPTQEVFLPSTVDVSVVGNSCGGAFPLLLNRRYTFLLPPGKLDSDPPPSNTQHVFRFELPNRGNVRVELTNFVPRAGQLVVWSGVCGSLQLLGRNPNTALNKTVNLGSLPAVNGQGEPIQYIVQIINDGRSNRVDLYGLEVVFE